MPTVQPTPAETPTVSPAEVEKNVSPKPEPTPRRVKRSRKVEATPTAQSETRPTPPSTQPETRLTAPIKARSWIEERVVAAKIKSLEKEWEASFNDPAVIEKTLADDFVGTSPAGEIVTKKDLLREAQKASGPAPKTDAHDLDVHFQGADLAVVTGAARQFNRNRAGQLVQHNYRFTDTWVERDGKWQCIASQSMLVPGE